MTLLNLWAALSAAFFVTLVVAYNRHAARAKKRAEAWREANPPKQCPSCGCTSPLCICFGAIKASDQ